MKRLQGQLNALGARERKSTGIVSLHNGFDEEEKGDSAY